MFRRGEDGRAARSTEQNGYLVALNINDRFERAAIRFVFMNQFGKAIANRDEAGGRAQRTRVMDDSEIKRAWLSAIRIHHGNAGVA